MDEKQAIDLLWEEWKYRHDLIWRLLFRWAGAVVTLWVIPFLKPDIFKPFPWVSLIFPSLGFFLSILSAWLLAGEQKRFDMVNELFKELRGNYRPRRFSTESLYGKLLAFRIGVGVVWFYGAGFAFASVLEGLLLYRYIVK